MRRRWVVRFTALLAAGAPCLLAAQPERAEATLGYTLKPGAEVCPASQALEDAVAARLGYFPFRFEAARSVTVRIERQGAGLRAEVELRESDGRVSGSRELTTPSDDCRGLIDSIAVAISLGLDPLSLSRPQPSASSPASVAPVVSAPAPLPVPAVSSAPPPSAPVVGQTLPLRPGVVVPWQLRATLGPQVWRGTAPANALGLMASVSLRRGFFSVAIEGRDDLRTTVREQGVSVASSILAVGLAPCLHRGMVLGCLLAQMGTIAAEGRGLDQPRQDHSLYVALGARAGLEIHLGASLFLRPHLDVLAPLHRAVFFVDARPVWTAPSLSGSLGLDLGIDFL